MFVLLFLLSIQISFQLNIGLNISNNIPKITSTIKQSLLLQKLSVNIPLLYTCFGTPKDCFNMALETTYFHTFLDGTGEYFNKFFNKEKSNTFNSTNQTLFFNYQNKILKGNVGLDKIMINEVKDKDISNEKFGFILLEENNTSIDKILVDGIIGLKKNDPQTNNSKLSFLHFFNIKSNFSFDLTKDKNNNLKGNFLLDENIDNNVNYSICKSSNNFNHTTNITDDEWKCNIINISIGIGSNTPIPFNTFAYFSVINPLIEFPYEIGFFILYRLYEQSEGECEIIKEENISIFVCNEKITDISKFEKIYLYYNNTNPILLNPRHYFEKANGKYICKIVQNNNIKNIILGIPAFLDNTFIFDIKQNEIKIKENKENYTAYIIIIGIIALILIVIPVIIFIYEKNKNEKSFRKLDIDNTNKLIEK